jgi:hypothetical protein
MVRDEHSEFDSVKRCSLEWHGAHDIIVIAWIIIVSLGVHTACSGKKQPVRSSTNRLLQMLADIGQVT